MVATNPIELRAKRRLLAEYLASDHILVSLKRAELVKTPAGGVRRDEDNAETLEPQMFRLYPQVRRMPDLTRDTPDGDITNQKWIMVGLYTADVKAADWFEHDGGLYDVVAVDPKREDRTACNVTYRGPASDEAWGS